MISIFGGSGFIGSKFCEMYSSKVSHIVNRDDNNVPKDCNNILYLISTIDNYNVYTDPHLDINTNLVKLMSILKNVGRAQTFTFISSWFVYGDTDCPAREDSPCNPRGFYSITKRAAEQLVISYCETMGIPYQIIRLCNVYGETDKKVSHKRNALQYMIGELAKGNDINLYNEGTDKRDFMYVDDVCRAIHLLIKYPQNRRIINVGSGKGYEFGTLMHYAHAKLGSKSQINHIYPPDFHKTVQVKDMYLDITKLKDMGFRQGLDIWQGLDRIIECLK